MTDRADLPPFMAGNVEKDIQEEPVFLHNWLYSVVPSSKYYNHYTSDKPEVDFPFYAFLVGYCRNCGKAFSQEVPTLQSGAYLETQLQVAKEGCVGA